MGDFLFEIWISSMSGWAPFFQWCERIDWRGRCLRIFLDWLDHCVFFPYWSEQFGWGSFEIRIISFACLMACVCENQTLLLPWLVVLDGSLIDFLDMGHIWFDWGWGGRISSWWMIDQHFGSGVECLQSWVFRWTRFEADLPFLEASLVEWVSCLV